jgi:hypothetical protein
LAGFMEVIVHLAVSNEPAGSAAEQLKKSVYHSKAVVTPPEKKCLLLKARVTTHRFFG